MSHVAIRAARGRRQVYLTNRGYLRVMAPDLSSMLCEFQPAIVEGAPSLRIIDPTGKQCLVLSASVFRQIYRYLPVLFNAADRLRSRATTELQDRDTLTAVTVNNDDQEGDSK